jgi:hypothetical protein
VRMKFHSALTGLVYMLLTSVVWLCILTVVGNLGSERQVNWQGMFLWTILLGPFGCLLCIHFLAPIFIGTMALAGRLVEAPQEAV